MKTLLKNAYVINVFTDEIEKTNVLLDEETIVGVGDYNDSVADITEDLSGKYICPGLIDGHIHIESTMLSAAELAKICVPRGTTAIVADPHEIANVGGTDGIRYMLETSENIPLTVYMMLPSCVPATSHDEAGATLKAEDLLPLYEHPRVLGLGEMMNYPGVLMKDPDVMQKISDAKEKGKIVNGHAPLLSGKALDQYIGAGIYDDHECSSVEEGKERIRKGQFVMIREGTAARNLQGLLPLFDTPWNSRCMLVTDDRHPADLLNDGHMDNIIRKAVENGKSAVVAIRMATIQTAQYFGLCNVGAIAPGYLANLVVLDDPDSFAVKDVYCHGKKVVEHRNMISFETPKASEALEYRIRNSFQLEKLEESDFMVKPSSSECRIIKIIPRELLTDEWITSLDFTSNNGVDIERDILKIAVIERHHGTGHIGLGFIHGIGLKKGAIASSVSHDSHNLIVIGTNEKDMALAANRVRTMNGGNAVVADGKILAEMMLPVGGLMSDDSAEKVAEQNHNVRAAVDMLGKAQDIEPFMNMAFISLPVIPHLKITTKGLVDVQTQTQVPLFLA
ncbi:MAG: adenine deaminase [Clostridia bacterium]|nr:adenine deaminase [Clostridia bacterium]